MACTTEYLVATLKEKLGPRYLVLSDRVVEREPYDIHTIESIFFWRKKFYSIRRTLFKYKYIAHIGQVKVWVHDGFTAKQADTLFSYMPVILDKIVDVAPDSYVEVIKL